jgi:predicted CXXCH cytochrome family protein
MVWIGAILSAIVVGVGGFALQYFSGGSGHAPAFFAAPAFVGSETCASCHAAEAGLWQRSQHNYAMQHATDASVLGDFNDAGFDYFGVHSRFFRQDGKFFVETDGPNGKLAAFEAKYTFGIDPLQQYLVEFPDGRLQALPLAWDTRPKEKGGQRWFHLYPNEEIRHDDVLHWTKLNQNWNFMCAGCHSTGVRKNYDAAHDRFATRFAEIGVGCEACHGEGSRHAAWAREQAGWWPFGKHDDPAKGLLVRFDERNGVTWSRDPTTGMPRRSVAPAILRKEVETCGLCHARGGAFSEDWVPGRWLSDTHVVSLFARGLLQADGQMRDVEETYNYAAFKQSKMFAMGVTCSDCHDPHSAVLRAPGDGVCSQCHAPDRYATAVHRHHDEANPSLSCASCHMPARTYMVVDRRHDHSFRVPRPDLSAKLGTPNACNDCHTDKSADWAASAIEQWYGPNRKGFQNYAGAFHAAWTDAPDRGALLAAIIKDMPTPAIARASALSELAANVSPSNVGLARAGLSDSDPLVRIGALDMLENVPAEQIWPLAAPLLAPVPTARQPAGDRDRFERAAGELIAAQRLNADRPEARGTLGNFYVLRGRAAEAETEFKAALRLEPQFAPAAINLADLYRQLRRDDEGASVLRAAIVASPQDAGLHHALGLAWVRAKRFDAALEELHRAVELAPDRARYAYVYAVALHSAGRSGEALAILEATSVRQPNDRDTLIALIGFNREAGDLKSALEHAERLARIDPADKEVSTLIDSLQRQIESGRR